jgi:triacylglycerol lipase
MSPTNDTLWPPNPEYPFFERLAAHPFDHTATGFERVNAAWSMDLSLLVYTSDKPLIRDRLSVAGFDANVRFIGFGALGPSTQALVTWNEDTVFVAFRGSEIQGPDRLLNIIADWATNAAILLTPLGGGVFVHTGFYAAVNVVWNRLRKVLNPLVATRSLWLTGHSLGAACATIAASRADRAGIAVQGVHTFGSPRVGNAAFRDAFRPRSYRLVHGRDLVTGVPGLGPHDGLIYHHVSPGLFMAHDGTIGAEAPSDIPVFGGMGAPAPLTAGGPLLTALLDHSPKVYAERLSARLG